MLRPNLWHRAGQAALLICPIMGPVIAVAAWWTYFHQSFALWLTLTIVAVGLIVMLGAIWALTVPPTNFGIVVRNDGVLVFDRMLVRGMVYRRLVAWDELGRPSLAGWPLSVVVVWTAGHLLLLCHDQARAVLTHPDCPLRDNLPIAISEKIGVSTPAVS